MDELKTAVAVAMKREREKVLAQPLARVWPDLAAAALRAITDAGYLISPIEDRQLNLEEPRG